MERRAPGARAGAASVASCSTAEVCPVLVLAFVHVCARVIVTRGCDRPQSAQAEESRPRFTEVGHDTV